MIVLVTAKVHPYDNTYIENFHSMLKRELVFQINLESIDEAMAGIDWDLMMI